MKAKLISGYGLVLVMFLYTFTPAIAVINTSTRINKTNPMTGHYTTSMRQPDNQTLKINGNCFKYSGYYQDCESNNYYLNARYYSPVLKRFTSRDSYDLVNRYAYCNGNPVDNVDPTGHIQMSTTSWAIFAIGMAMNLAEIGSTFTTLAGASFSRKLAIRAMTVAGMASNTAPFFLHNEGYEVMGLIGGIVFGTIGGTIAGKTYVELKTNEVLTTANTADKTRIAALEEQITQLRTDRDTALSTRRSAEIQNNSLNTSNQGLERAVEQLQNQINNLQQDRAVTMLRTLRHNGTHLRAELIPVLRNPETAKTSPLATSLPQNVRNEYKGGLLKTHGTKGGLLMVLQSVLTLSQNNEALIDSVLANPSSGVLLPAASPASLIT